MTPNENDVLLYWPANIVINLSYQLTDRQAVTVIVHELDHAIGLKHNDNPQSIMDINIGDTGNPIDYNFDKPTPADIAKVKELYNEN